MSVNLTTDLFEYPSDGPLYREKVEALLKATFRPANILMTNVQICLMFWVLGKSLSYDQFIYFILFIRLFL